MQPGVQMSAPQAQSAPFEASYLECFFDCAFLDLQDRQERDVGAHPKDLHQSPQLRAALECQCRQFPQAL